MHWSRLADVPLGLAILLFSMVFESRTAETLALVCVPPLLLLFTAVFLGRAAKNVGGAPAETWARLLLVSAIFVLLQYIPGRVDHHGLQLLLLSGALMAATSKPTRQSGLIVALPTSISLLVGLENVPLLLAIPGWIAFTWLWEGRDRQAQLEGFAVGIIVFLPALYALSVAPSDWSRPTYDEIGRGHIAVVVAGGLALAAAVWTKPPSFGWRMAALGLAAIVAALPLLAFPEVAAVGPAGQPLRSCLEPLASARHDQCLAYRRAAERDCRQPFLEPSLSAFRMGLCGSGDRAPQRLDWFIAGFCHCTGKR